MTFKARLNRSIHHAAKVRWYDPEMELQARIREKSARYNLKDGRAVFSLGN